MERPTPVNESALHKGVIRRPEDAAVATARGRTPGGSRKRQAEQETWRLLAMSLDARFQPRSDHRSLLVTSPRTIDSASSVAIMLAHLQSAEAGRATLLIDGSGGEKSLTHNLSLNDAHGLCDILDHCEAHALKKAVIAHENGLSILPFGRPMQGRLGVLSPESLSALLSVARSEFHEILVTTRGVLDDATTQRWSKAVDGVLLVSTSGVTLVADLEHSMKKLADFGSAPVATLMARLT